jgi:hypothetical protein
MASPDMAASPSPLNPIVIPASSPLVPDWAREAVRRLNLLTAATVAAVPDQGNEGGNAFGYSSSNAQLMLPSGYTGNIALEKLSTIGGDGLLTVKNGRIVSVIQPT